MFCFVIWQSHRISMEIFLIQVSITALNLLHLHTIHKSMKIKLIQMIFSFSKNISLLWKNSLVFYFTFRYFILITYCPSFYNHRQTDRDVFLITRVIDKFTVQVFNRDFIHVFFVIIENLNHSFIVNASCKLLKEKKTTTIKVLESLKLPFKKNWMYIPL